MHDSESPFEILADKAKAEGIPMARLCERANVAQSTPSRWRAGTFEPRYRTIRRLEAALAEIIAAKDLNTSAEG